MIITSKEVLDIYQTIQDRPPETLEEVLIYRYYNCNNKWRDDLSNTAKGYNDSLSWVFRINYDEALLLTYPNLLTCLTTGNRGEREVFNYNLPYLYYPHITHFHLAKIIVAFGKGNTIDVVNAFKEEFKRVTGEEFIAITDSELVGQFSEAVMKTQGNYRTNLPRPKCTVFDGATFVCELTEYHIKPVFSPITRSHLDLKSEKYALERYPNKYLSKELLKYGLSNFIINRWEYDFYLSILSKPKPRKLSKKQCDMYQKINRKIYWEI